MKSISPIKRPPAVKENRTRLTYYSPINSPKPLINYTWFYLSVCLLLNIFLIILSPFIICLHGGTPGIETAILRQYLLIFIQIYIYFQATYSQCKPITPKMLRPPQTNPPKNTHPKTKYRKILILYSNKF